MKEAAFKSMSWSHGVFTLEALGGMLGPTLFVLPDGGQVTPFHIAPWFDDEIEASTPGILQRLRGEWACVPFGSATNRKSMYGWPSSDAAQEIDCHPHGYGSNNCWSWVDSEDGVLTINIDYPECHPVARLKRRVQGIEGRPALEFELTIETRRSCQLPIGLHPVFRLNEQVGSMQLEIDAQTALTFPGEVDKSSIFRPGEVIADWRSVPTRNGQIIDASRLPLEMPTEDLLQLVQTGGRARLTNSIENYEVELTWQKEHFPDALLWFSNQGRTIAPWNGRNLCLGIEPVCSAFDFGVETSSTSNMINALGSPTCLAFGAGQTFITRYGVEVRRPDPRIEC